MSHKHILNNLSKAPEFNKNDWHQKLKLLSLSPTKHRLALLECFFETNKPITPNQIFISMGRRMDLTTIYRNIDHFLNKGIIKQIDFGHEEKYYEMLNEGDDHHHIICKQCNKVADFTGCGVGYLIKDALNQNTDFASIDGHTLELFGYCRRCYNRKV